MRSDISTDPELRRAVDEEFNTIWNSLVADMNTPLNTLRNGNFNMTKTQSLLNGSWLATSEHHDPLQLSNTMVSTGSNMGQNGSQGASPTPLRLDAAATLIKPVPVPNNATLIREDKNDQGETEECKAFINAITWESPDYKRKLLLLTERRDPQLLSLYRSLKGFKSSFITVATKHVKYLQVQ